MSKVAKHITFVGRVQGVGFRFTAFNAANRFRLTGLVRNSLDGTVEMIVQGNSDEIDKCVGDITETYQSSISETKIEEISFEPKYKDFKITF